MDTPDDVKDKGNKFAESIYKKGHSDGKAEGQKMSKDKFSIEVNSMGTQVVNGKAKDGYKAPSPEDCGKKSSQVFGYGKVPNRNDFKALVMTLLKAMESMPIAEKTKPQPQPKPAST